MRYLLRWWEEVLSDGAKLLNNLWETNFKARFPLKEAWETCHLPDVELQLQASLIIGHID